MDSATYSVSLFSKAEAEAFDRRTHNVPDDVGLGWQPYTIRVLRNTMGHRAFYSMQAFKAWMRQEGVALEIHMGWQGFRSGVLVPA